MMILPDNFDPEERGARARDYFLAGYNCCQSVLMAFSDVLQANRLAGEPILKIIGSGFGGGFARMREVCGSFTACTMLAGFISPADTTDLEVRKTNYALVQDMAADFRALNGSIVCSEMLELKERQAEGPAPSERTPEYYKKRPCVRMVETAIRIYCNYLEG